VLLAVASAHKSHNPLTDLRDKLSSHLVLDQEKPISVVASPKVLNKSGDIVTVLISGVEKPLIGDLIAVYSPADVDTTKTTPIKFMTAKNFGSDYLKTGSGQAEFRIVNMHADVGFYFYKNASGNSWRSNKLAFGGKSEPIAFSNFNEPNQGHIALTGKPGEMKVMWASGTRLTTQILRVGTKSGKYELLFPAKTDTYKPSDLCGSPANSWGWKDPGYLHEAVAKSLTPGATYYYIFGSTKTGWSPEASFVAPAPAGPTQSIQFVAFGDLGKYEVDGTVEHWGQDNAPFITTQKILKTVQDGKAEMVLHVGDVAYAVGYSAQWDEFLEQIGPVASRVPWMTLPGNHERDWINGKSINGTDSGGECGVPYEKRFRMPTSAPDQPWYSFDHGPVHFVTMSTEHFFQVGTVQNDWIAKDLASVDRKKTPWVVFSGHRPMYIDSTNWEKVEGDQTVAEDLRKHVEPLLVKNKVDVAFWGHHHSYQRSCPVSNLKCGSGPVHFVVGMAGFGLSPNINKDMPHYMQFVDVKEHGYTTVQVDEKNFRLQYWGHKGGLKDEAHLTK